MKDKRKYNIILLAIIFVLILFKPINVIAMEQDVIYNYDDFNSKSLIVKMDKRINFNNYGIKDFTYVDNEIVILNFESIEKTINCYEILKDKSYIDFIEPNMYLQLNEDELGDINEDENSAYNSWGVEYLGIDKYAKYIKTENKDDMITIAVVDTGIDYNHTIFKDKLLDSGYDFINSDNDPYDDNIKGHGTHVAGIIADATRDISNIKIMPIKALNYIGVGTVLSVGNSIKYATNSGVDIINLSLGFKSGVHSKFIEDAILDAIAAGVTVVIAAGNENLNTINSCPSHIDEAIIVSSIDSSNNKADTSNYGPNIDVAAPGVDIYSAAVGGNYIYKSGTSMAVPHISVIAAMLKLNNPELKPLEVENLIKEYSVDIGEKGVDWYFGNGVPNMTLALTDSDSKNVELNNSNEEGKENIEIKDNSIKEEENQNDISGEKEESYNNGKESVELIYLDKYYKSENGSLPSENNINYVDYYNNQLDDTSEENSGSIFAYSENKRDDIVKHKASNDMIGESIEKAKIYDNRIFILIAVCLVIVIFIGNKLYRKVKSNT